MGRDSSGATNAHPFSSKVRHDRPRATCCIAHVELPRGPPPHAQRPSSAAAAAAACAQVRGDSACQPRRALSKGSRSFGRTLDEAYAHGQPAASLAPGALSSSSDETVCEASGTRRNCVNSTQAAASPTPDEALHSLQHLFEARAACVREVQTPFGSRTATCADGSAPSEPQRAIEAFIAAEATGAARGGALWAYAGHTACQALRVDSETFEVRFVHEGGAAAAMWQAARLVGLRRKALKARRPVVLYCAACCGAVERLWRGAPVTAVVRTAAGRLRKGCFLSLSFSICISQLVVHLGW